MERHLWIGCDRDAAASSCRPLGCVDRRAAGSLQPYQPPRAAAGHHALPIQGKEGEGAQPPAPWPLIGVMMRRYSPTGSAAASDQLMVGCCRDRPGASWIHHGVDGKPDRRVGPCRRGSGHATTYENAFDYGHRRSVSRLRCRGAGKRWQHVVATAGQRRSRTKPRTTTPDIRCGRGGRTRGELGRPAAGPGRWSASGRNEHRAGIRLQRNGIVGAATSTTTTSSRAATCFPPHLRRDHRPPAKGLTHPHRSRRRPIDWTGSGCHRQRRHWTPTPANMSWSPCRWKCYKAEQSNSAGPPADTTHCDRQTRRCQGQLKAGRQALRFLSRSWPDTDWLTYVPPAENAGAVGAVGQPRPRGRSADPAGFQRLRLHGRNLVRRRHHRQCDGTPHHFGARPGLTTT